MTVSEFLNMGGYAAYVWGAYGLCAVVLAANVVVAVRRQRHIVRQIQRRLRRTA